MREKFTGKPEHVVNYLFMVAEEARRIMAELGFRTIDEMVGRSEVLNTDDAIKHWKSDGLDLTAVLHAGDQAARKRRRDSAAKPKIMAWKSRSTSRHCSLEARPAIETKEPVVIESPIVNINRTGGNDSQ